MHHSHLLLALAAALSLSSGCKKSSSSDDDDGGTPSLLTIEVTPADTLFELAIGATASQAFTATGTFDDDSVDDVTDEVTWSLANGAIGSFTGATAQVNALAAAGAAGSVVSATLGGIEGDAYLTVVAVGTADLLFTLPHLEVVPEQETTLVAKPPAAADVFFVVDVTGSMGGELTNLKSSLTTTIVPGIRATIPDSNFGVAGFMDFPVSPYGDPACAANGSLPDQPLVVKQVLTSSLTTAQTGANALSLGCGADGPESQIEALYQTATGGGLNAPSPTSVPAVDLGFREGAAHLVLVVSDTASHAPGEATTCGMESVDYGGTVIAAAHTRAATKTALAASCTKVLGVASDGGTCSGLDDQRDFSTATGTRVPPTAWDAGTRPAGCAANQCCTGLNGAGVAADMNGLCPLVFRVDGTGAGIGNSLVTGFTSAMLYTGREITAVIAGETESVDGAPLASGSTADFVESVTPLSFTEPAAPPSLPDPTFDAGGFHGVAANTVLDWDVTAYNDLVPEDPAPRLFRAELQVVADGCEILDRRTLYFLVPRAP